MFGRRGMVVLALSETKMKGKKVMNAEVDGRSARGRPTFGWMDGVKRALNDRKMDVREASERVRDRNEWQMIVTQF